MNVPTAMNVAGSAPAAEVDGALNRPRLWFVCPGLGKLTDHWLLRQVQWIARLDTRVVCWEMGDAALNTTIAAPIHRMSFPLHPDHGPRRWLIRAINCPTGNYFASVGSEKRALNELLDRTGPQVILGHYGHMALRILPLAMRRKIPVVAYFHGLDLAGMLKNRWYAKSLRRNLKHFAACLTVGKPQMRWLCSQGYPEARAHAIASGTRTDVFAPAGAAPEGPARFVAVSRLKRQKGVDYTLRAFAEVRKHIPAARLEIIGDGPDRAAFETLARELGLEQQVRFHGALPADEVLKWLQQSHVFLQHSLDDEGFGNSITEACSCSLPVVVTDCGGILDQVEHGKTGLVVPQRDAAAMAEAMLKLASDHALRSRMGASGRERAVRDFDAKVSLQRLEQVLIDAAREVGR